MSSRDLQIDRNAASRAATKSATAPGTKRADGELCASRRIHEACQILRELLLRDDFNFGNSMLLGAVSEGLDRISIELVELIGLQKLFELWVDTKEGT